MLEALWLVKFASNVVGEDFDNMGGGVAIFKEGRIFGGDSMYYYLGSYELENKKLSAEITVTHYFGPQNSVFGKLSRFTLVLEGEIKENKFNLFGHVKEKPELKMFSALTKQAELP